MVRRYWPNTDPIGKRITFGDPTAADVEWITVIGVVEHTAHEGLDAEHRVQLYRPVLQRPISQMTFALRSQGDPTQLVTSVRQAVLNIDPDQPIAQIRTMDAMMDEALGQRKLTMYLLGTFAGLALLLSAIGIYGVMSFDVTRRSQDIGVRMALGAASSSVLWLVMKQGVGLALVGVAIGLAGAFALTRVLEAQLFGITPTDPATFASVALVLTLVATMATLIPALRATRLDPVRALRCE
jgi:putative ABC transport system permease protein